MSDRLYGGCMFSFLKLHQAIQLYILANNMNDLVSLHLCQDLVL